jgi:hypothetical protein
VINRSAWRAAAMLAFVTVSGKVATAQSAMPNPPASVPGQKAVFQTGESSSGWIDIGLYPNVAIYVPVKINGREAMALLNPGEPSSIDKDFAASIGVPNKDAASSVQGLVIEVGDVELQNTSAKPDDLFTMPVGVLGRPVSFLNGAKSFKPFLLGDEFFRQVAVDIDFSNHRIAFRDPNGVAKPAGAVAVPLVDLDGVRTVPVSINGGPSAPFALHISNVIGPMMATPSYAQAHQLLEGHRTSQRLSRPFSETIVAIDHVNFAGVDFPQVPLAIIPDTALPSASINGDVGLPLLAKFRRMIIDYSHNVVYEVSDEATAKTPIPRDRIGMILYLGGIDGDFGVAFVSPGSPAEAAGFKKGDRIKLIDGKPFDAWSPLDITKFHLADVGTAHTFVMADGTKREIKAADFF